MEKGAGTYALLLACEQARRINIGRLGPLTLQPGCYVYVGSAFGPGGVAARVRRHCRRTKPRHWHIDYLRAHAAVVEIWYSLDPARREHDWAAILACLAGATEPLPGFGACDCRCTTHLFHFNATPRLARFRNAVLRAHPRHAGIQRMPCPAQERRS